MFLKASLLSIRRHHSARAGNPGTRPFQVRAAPPELLSDHEVFYPTFLLRSGKNHRMLNTLGSMNAGGFRMPILLRRPAVFVAIFPVDCPTDRQ